MSAASLYTVGNGVERVITVILRHALFSSVSIVLARHDSALTAAEYSAVE